MVQRVHKTSPQPSSPGYFTEMRGAPLKDCLQEEQWAHCIGLSDFKTYLVCFFDEIKSISFYHNWSLYVANLRKILGYFHANIYQT